MKTQAAAQPARAPAKSTATNRKAQARSDPALRALLNAPESQELGKLSQQVRREAAGQKNLPKPNVKRKEVEAAAVLEVPEQNDQSSKEKSSEKMGKVAPTLLNAKTRFGAERFKQDFAKLLRDQNQAVDADDVKAYAKDPPLNPFPGQLSADMVKQQGDIVKPLQEQSTRVPPPDAPKKEVGIPPPRIPAQPAQPDSKLAVPPARKDWETWAPIHRNTLNGAMQAHRLTDEQLAESREPQFVGALGAKQQAEQKVDEAAGAYAARESTLQEGSEANAGALLAGKLQGMNILHRFAAGRVLGNQKKTETDTERRQRFIKGEIDRIYKRTVSGVQDTLKSMAEEVKGNFKKGLDAHSKVFNQNVRKLIDKYYGWTTLDDKLFGPADVVVERDGSTRSLTAEEILGRAKRPEKLINPDVYEIFLEQKAIFVAGMEGELDKIATQIETRLTAVANLIEKGETDITNFKATLSGDEKRFADTLEADVKTKFENLKGTIDDARNDLLNELVTQYRETSDQLETTFREINDELKKSFIDRAVEFIETVGRTIYQLAELLFSVLTRMVHLVWDIISHPIRFFGTLVEGIGRGVGRFIEGFGTYLQEGFWTWVSGKTPGGVQLSGSSGIGSLFNVVLQVLSLGPPQLREIATQVLGRRVMDHIDRALAIGEKALEPVELLLTKGPLAVWDHLRESLNDLVQSTFDRIKEAVFFALVKKALKWIAGFFVPGGGFVKVVQAIFRAFQFVADNLQRIKAFFDAVFSAMQDAVEGRSEGVATKVLDGLKIGIVLALDFLAKQLGLANLADDVRKILDSLRRPIVRAITFLLTKIKPFITRLVDSIVNLGKGAVSAGKAVVERVRNWWTARKAFKSEGGEPHTLYLEGNESGARLMIRSEPESYADFITRITTGLNLSDAQKRAKTEAMGIADELDKAVASASRRRRGAAQANDGLQQDPSDKINELLDKLAAATARFIPDEDVDSSEPVFGPLVHGFGSSVRAAQLTKKHKDGSIPGVDGGHWEALRRRKYLGGHYYVRGHLLNDNIGGSGKTWSNLTPLTQHANVSGVDSMLRKIEQPVKDKVKERGSRVHYVVTAHYGRTHRLARKVAELTASDDQDYRDIAKIVQAEQHIPTQIVGEAINTPANSRKREQVVAKQTTVHNVIEDSSVAGYQLTEEPIKLFYLSDYLNTGHSKQALEIAAGLLQLDKVTPEIVESLVKNRPASGYRTIEQLKKAGLKWEAAVATKGLRVRIYRVES